MSKPEDISQEAWRIAERAFYDSAPNAVGAVEAIARAIMAEREACAAEVVAYLAAVTAANDEGRELLSAAGLATNETDRRGLLVSTISDDLANAIRKRGDVSAVHNKNIVEG